MNTGPVQPNLRLAQAYGLSSPRSTGNDASPARAAAVRDIAELSPLSSLPNNPANTPRKPSPKIAALVAAKVSQPALAPTPSPFATGDALPLYTNPALRNAAATGVSLGRTLDIQG